MSSLASIYSSYHRVRANVWKDLEKETYGNALVSAVVIMKGFLCMGKETRTLALLSRARAVFDDQTIDALYICTNRHQAVYSVSTVTN